MYERILIVCTGNICRSPLAEAMLRLQLRADGHDPQVQVRSAGTRALVGRPVDDTVLFVARERSDLLRELQQHAAQQLNSTLLWWADLILIMEMPHARSIERMDRTARSKIHLLGQWIGSPIADPYLKHEHDYRTAHGRIEQAVLSWRNRILR